MQQWLESLSRDLRYAVRSFARERTTSAAVVIMLALGIGANVAIFTLLNAVWLRPLPYRDAGRLVTLEDSFVREGIERIAPTIPEFVDVRAWNRSFESMAFLDHRDLQLTGGQEPVRVFGARVTASFFPLLGTGPALGRLFTDTDNQEGNERVAILSYGLWQRAFAGDREVIGRTIMIDQRPHEVVGVAAAGFSFEHPAIGIREPADVYVPFLMNDYYMLRSGSHSHLRRVIAIARLRPDVGVRQANAELSVLGARLEREHPDLYRRKPSGEAMGFTIQARALQEAVSGETRAVLLLLFACVGMVLLIACANAAQFLLARSLQRQDEVAIRLALGASRGRLVRQFLTEAIVLAGAAGLLGLIAADALVTGIKALLPASDPLLAAARADGTVLTFALGVSLLTAVLFGMLPAMSGSHATRRIVRGRAGSLPRYALVAVEVALSMVLLAGAAVLVRGLLHISQAPLGYSADDVTMMSLRLNQPRPDMRSNGSMQYEAYLAALRQVPGVEAAAVLSGQPVPLTDANFVVGSHQGDADALARQTARLIVSPEYFRTLRIPLIEGRAFELADTSDRPAVAIVNEAVARHLWPNESALGKQLRLPRVTTVVGVVGSTRLSARTPTMTPQIYVPSLQFWEPNTTIAVRTAAGMSPPHQAFKQAIWSVAPGQAIFNMRSMSQALSNAVAEPRFRTSLLGGFALLALVLSAAGIYGLVAYLVSRRTRELAIRVAIGATRRDLYWLVVRQTIVSTCLGLLAGVLMSAAATRALGTLIRIDQVDAPALAMAGVLYLAIALIATYVPARRAFSIDTVRALGSV